MRGLSPRIAGLPVRVRLTVFFAGAMAVLFAILGVLLYLEFHASVNASINRGLRARSGELVALVQHTAKPISTLAERPSHGGPGAPAQVLGRAGQVLQASPGLGRTALLTKAEVARSFQRPYLVDRGERMRLYATRASPRKVVVVVGVSLAQQQSAFHTFNWELLAGLPVILILAAGISYIVTGRLLGPIESMRTRAQAISAEDLDLRLPLPESVDELHRLASTLNQMLDRLHDGLERERTFVSDASHELRGPLAVLKGELEVALRVGGSEDDWRAAVGSAIEEADRVIGLAEDLLVLARAPGGIPLACSAIDARELLHDVARRGAFRPAARVSIAVAAELTIDGDRGRLAQALGNLLDNALRCGAVNVELRAVEPAPGLVEVHVLDDGPGFPEEFLPHAFERFSRADAARGRGGAGLGLAIVETVVRAHGGKVGVANRPGGGADVWLSLRRSADGEEP